MTTVTPQCFSCREYRGLCETAPEGPEYRCAAFGDRPIPEDLLWNRSIHDKPYPGDHGIRFTACSDEGDE